MAVTYGVGADTPRIVMLPEDGSPGEGYWLGSFASGDPYTQGLEMIVGDTEDIVGAPDPTTGLLPLTSKVRLRVLAGPGGTAQPGTETFRTGWMTFAFPPFLDPYGQWPSIGMNFRGGGMANGPANPPQNASGDYLVFMWGFEDWSGSGKGKVKVWVYEPAPVNATLVKFHVFKDAGLQQIRPDQTQIMDYDGDGLDEIVVVRVKQNAAGPNYVKKFVEVHDLTTGTLKYSFNVLIKNK